MTANFANDGGPFEHTIEASFQSLELCLERLAKIAPVHHPRQLTALLPESMEAASQLLIGELIKFDLAAAAQANVPRGLDFYWPAVEPFLPRAEVPLDLVLEEVQLRRASGEDPRVDDYLRRFPNLADTFVQLLEGSQTHVFCDSTSSVPELPVGQRVDDFFILKQLGRGAFARVYLARQESMQRLVALKATLRGSEEPQALSKLDHENIVRVYDQRIIDSPKTILLYMQYLAGGTLADCIARLREQPQASWGGSALLASIDRSLLEANQTPPEQAAIRSELQSMEWSEVVAWIGIQLAEGLGYANQVGVLHRDVKPANILLSAEGIPKLADFNVSCSGMSGRAGAAAYFGGSLAYMSPEQLDVADPTYPATADQLDERSDLYALGMVLWELWQATRPWNQQPAAANWTDAVQQQRQVRETQFVPHKRAETATERALERVLRSLLAIAPEHRPQSGKEVAARLQLALRPELAQRFEPAPNSLAGWVLRMPVLLVSAILIFGPNTAASQFNYLYNRARMADMNAVVPGILASFDWVALLINSIVFPLGAIMFLAIVWPIASMVNAARRGQACSPRDIAKLFHVGNRATMICGILWTVSGIAFAAVFSSLHPEFQRDDALHFFLSLVLCGAVAWIYPYFGMTLVSLLVYYPIAIAATLDDPDFDARCQRIRRHSGWYLLSAAAIPLVALGLLLLRSEIPRQTLVSGLCITGVGLLASFLAYQTLDETLRQLARVLSKDSSGRVR